MGKGSSRRPTDEDKFGSNFDAIFGKRKPLWEQKREEKEAKQKLKEQNESSQPT